jgi:SP family sugar:H+ symporter-like MFS transporter
MGVNIGRIFGSVAGFSVVWSYFFSPLNWTRANRLRQARSLEEVDELFEARLSARHFDRYETVGTGRLLATLENQGEDTKKEDAHDSTTEV